MHRFASTDTDVDREARQSMDAARAMMHSESVSHRSGVSYSPHTSARFFNASSRSLPDGGGDEPVVHMGAAKGAEGAAELMEEVPKERQIYVEVYLLSFACCP